MVPVPGVEGAFVRRITARQFAPLLKITDQTQMMAALIAIAIVRQDGSAWFVDADAALDSPLDEFMAMTELAQHVNGIEGKRGN